MNHEDLLNKYPAISDLKARAKRKMPTFAWEYLDSGTGAENLYASNKKAYDNITIVPRSARGVISADTDCALMGEKFGLPIGVAPVGMTGIFWPKAELLLAATAKKFNIPFCLSTVACERIEEVAAIAGSNAWFQLYPLKDWDVNLDIMARARESGVKTLVVTIDVPTPSMRERQRRAGLKIPPAITISSLMQSAFRPHWALLTAMHGTPHFKNLVKYAGSNGLAELADYLKNNKTVELVWDDLKKIRDAWDGKLVIKGILHPDDALNAVKIGADAIIVSNHGGRQFDGGPTSISMLGENVAKVKGKLPVMLDSGISTGLDIVKAYALGADYVFAGRAFMFGVAAKGGVGADHAAYIFKKDLQSNMEQLGSQNLKDLRKLDVKLG